MSWGRSEVSWWSERTDDYGTTGFRNQRLAAIWQVMAKLEPELKSVMSVQFYDIQKIIIPEEKNRNPLSRILIYQLQLN